jgi:hypothetical protein
MTHRKVSEEQVAETLESPDELMPGESGEMVAAKRFGVREVRVVYHETEPGSVVIYTVMKPRVRNGSEMTDAD